ncbi:MAG: class I SAM-dependent methyltransferase [Candidatus Sumerlaeota bacterium]|nr:class I SAM-dependent methyltransferase [Candidatus Sumerlaeota bacterium]
MCEGGRGGVIQSIRSLVRRAGFDVVRYPRPVAEHLADFSEANKLICETVKDYTMTSPERVNALVEAVRYVVINKIEGAFVECGVWRGGSVMAMMIALRQQGDDSRDFFLYDTFAGMTEPGPEDGKEELRLYHKTLDWCLSPMEETQANVCSTGYPRDRIYFIKGKVEDTLSDGEHAPAMIALLRLDTDWYESTRHELVHLFPRLQPGGVMIIDDYGCWQGCKQAVDEYIEENNIRMYLARIDESCRIGIKT